MKKCLISSLVLVIALSLMLSACGSAGGSSSGAPNVDWKLSITGAVSKPLTLSYAELGKRPQTTLKDVVMIRSQGEETKSSWTGPALADILKDAGISSKAKTITCSAKDGYAMEMTMEDIRNAIIALKQDDKWISSDEKGPIRLVAPDKTANFWIAMLQEIKILE